MQIDKKYPKVMYYWKLSRRIVSFIFFVITCLSVCFFLPQEWSNKILALQLGPAIIHLTSDAKEWKLAEIITLLLIVVGFGRIYCSTICPLGFLQDVSIWLGKFLRIKYNWEIVRVIRLKMLRVSIFAIAAVFLGAGSAFAAGLLEPFSIFSRSMFVLKMLFQGTVNGSVLLLLFISVTTITIILAAAKKGRFFCSWLCPVGTLFWGLSTFHIYKFRKNQTACNQCSKCLAICKAGAISSQTGVIDPALCVGCFNCISVCQQQAIRFVPEIVKTKTKTKTEYEKTGIAKSKRKFLRQFASVLFAMSTPVDAFTIEIFGACSGKEQLFPVFPLGANNLEHFNSKCTGCMICASKCPSKIIIPSIMDSFGKSLVVPVLDFHDNYCLEDCVACSQVCLTGALREVHQEDKKNTKMASLELDLKECQILKEGLECAICAEICPLQAIEMKQVTGQKFPIPFVIQSACNGCGKCQYRCPVKESSNIFRFSTFDLK